MSEKARDLLVRGVAAAKAKDVDEARFFLEWLLLTECTPEQRSEALFWLSEISNDVNQKRAYLEEVLEWRPNHYRAQRSLAVLDGRLDPQDIIDPDKPPPPPADHQTDTEAQRFVCQQCGGRMTYSPDGSSLECGYCAQRQSVTDSADDKQVPISWQDFTIAMATAKGHTHQVATRTFECQACGAVILLTPETASMKCPYCNAVYVLDQTETRQQFPPGGVIPFRITEDRAKQILVAWCNNQRLPAGIRMAPHRGLYFPAWIFTISGPLSWNCLVPDDNDWSTSKSMGGWESYSGIELVSQNNILVSASGTVTDKWISQFGDYNFDQVVPYDPAFLANWPAESYQITLSNASLEARSMILDQTRAAIKGKIAFLHKDLQLNSKDLMVESFNLVMLPLWFSHFRYEQNRYPILINGQTGKVWGAKPAGSVRNWLSSLFQDD
jgi:hypothetical protein